MLQASSYPKDVAAAVFFRIAFGFTCCFWAWDYLTSGRVTRLYVTPEFHFGYPLFDFVRPLPGSGMYWLFLVMLALALLIGIGWFYRAASIGFAICFT
jgi:hypothetical protein